MGPLIEFVCDEHVKADGVGPFITRHDGAWAYCAGHGADGHRWRKIAPTTRAALERTSEPASEQGSQDKAAG